MNLVRTLADDDARWPAVTRTLVGAAIIGYGAFLARALDMLVAPWSVYSTAHRNGVGCPGTRNPWTL